MGNVQFVYTYSLVKTTAAAYSGAVLEADGDIHFISQSAAENPKCPSEALKMVLARGKNDFVSQIAADNLNCPPDVLKMVLERGNDDNVSDCAAKNRNCPKDAKEAWEKVKKREVVRRLGKGRKSDVWEIRT